MCRVRQFCYCCRLRNGAIAAAMFTFTYSVSMIVAGALFLDHANHWGFESEFRDREYVGGWVQIIAGILTFIVFIFLVVAICQRRPACIIPWFIVAVFNLLIHAVIIYLAVGNKNWYQIGIVGFSILFVYLSIILYSYYMLLKERYFRPTSA